MEKFNVLLKLCPFPCALSKKQAQILNNTHRSGRAVTTANLYPDRETVPRWGNTPLHHLGNVLRAHENVFTSRLSITEKRR